MAFTVEDLTFVPHSQEILSAIWITAFVVSVGLPLIHLWKKRKFVATWLWMALSLACYFFLVFVVIPKLLGVDATLESLMTNPDDPFQDTLWKAAITEACYILVVSLLITSIGAGVFALIRFLRARRAA